MVTQEFDQLWAELAAIGRSVSSAGHDSAGYRRRPFEAAERECVAWLCAQCQDRGLRLEQDGNANLVAWWEPDGGHHDGAVLTGSHLDSVDDGGAFDGPLGIVSALAAIDRLRAARFVPTRPIGVVAFVGEEGSRFEQACLGSRLATGLLDAEAGAGLRDQEQTSLVEAMAAAGVEPDLGPSPFLRRVGCFVELHIEQGRTLIQHDAAIGVASGIWPHGRYRLDFTGEANHAGATRMEDRHDPMLSTAMTVLAANKQARLQDARATFGRLEVVPNGTNAIPSRVTGWMDARAADGDGLTALVRTINRLAAERAQRDGTRLTMTTESFSNGVEFDQELTTRIAALGGPRRWPAIPSFAGHDAGILATAGIATAMLFVRNPTGVSHAPAEHADPADCLAGVAALTQVLKLLAR